MPSSVLHLSTANAQWTLHRPGDLESYWDAMQDLSLDEDERLPYWVELWPAGIRLAQWLTENRSRITGRLCLDLGCGLGLSTCAARAAGGEVVGVDYAPEALHYAQHNERVNGISGVGWLAMDWRRPALKSGRFSCIWGADILYEHRFTAPLAQLFDALLAPGGCVWITEPIRDVSASAWAFFRSHSWQTRLLDCQPVSFQGMTMRVNLWEMRRCG